MDAPYQLTLRDLPSSPALTEHVERRVKKLDSMYDHVVGCRVVVEEPHRRHQQGKKFHVRIDLAVPRGELVVGRSASDDVAHEDAHAAIEKAFDEAERLLMDYARKVRGDVKRHAETPHARVSKLFVDDGYGFLETEDGREIYFHANSVLHGHFSRLSVGTMVRYAEEDGEKGPQASTVAVPRRSVRAGRIARAAAPNAPVDGLTTTRH